MPKYTPNLNIQLADPATDGNQTFNIETMINDPVEKLDEALGLVPVSGDVRVATTGNIVLSGAQTIDGIALSAGNRVLVKNQAAGKENGIYTVATGPWTRAVDANSTAKLAAGISVYVEEGAANGKTQWQMTNTGAVTLDTTAITFEKTGGAASATDAIIGSRTVSDTTAPTGDTGTVTTLFGWLASMIKAITGGATWRTLPGMSIAAIKTVLDAATNLGTASTLMKRDASGRAQVAAPSAAGDIARKDTVDGAITAHKAETDPHTGYVKKSGDTMGGMLSTPFGLNVAAGVVPPESIGNLWANGASGTLFYRDVTQYRPVLIGTNGDLNYYVRTDGNDNNIGTTNTVGGAFKTIGKAISMIPQIVNHNINIYVSAGTYPEIVYLGGYHGGGAINLYGDGTASTSRTIRRLIINNCSCYVLADGFNTTVTDVPGVSVINCSRVLCNHFNIIVVGDVGTAGAAADFSHFDFQNSNISNRYYAIAAGAGTQLFSQNNTGTGNIYAFSAYGSTLHYNGLYPESTSGNLTLAGGVVIQASGVVNPWGDNTANSRSTVLALKNTGQTINGQTLTKIIYDIEQWDTYQEYDPSFGRFTASKPGTYLISARLYIPSNTVSNGYEMYVFVNGTERRGLGITRASTTGTSTVGGEAIVKIGAGDYVEIMLGSDNNVTVAPHASRSTLDIVRLA